MPKSRKYTSCSVCGESIERTKLDVHMNSHMGKKPYQCSQCSKHYLSQTNLNKHLRDIHKLETSSKPKKKHDFYYICPEDNCQRPLAHFSSVQRHLEKQHPESNITKRILSGENFIFQKIYIDPEARQRTRPPLPSSDIPSGCIFPDVSDAELAEIAEAATAAQRSSAPSPPGSPTQTSFGAAAAAATQSPIEFSPPPSPAHLSAELQAAYALGDMQCSQSPVTSTAVRISPSTVAAVPPGAPRFTQPQGMPFPPISNTFTLCRYCGGPVFGFHWRGYKKGCGTRGCKNYIGLFIPYMIAQLHSKPT